MMIRPEKFRKIPVEIEAVQWSAMKGWETTLELADWCGGKAVRDKNPMNTEKVYYWSIEIPTLEGVLTASPGDYIIKGVVGEFYACKPNVFEMTYEEVSDG